jgi:hypothetical protein
MDSVRAVLIDIDGVLTGSWQPLPGAVDALREIHGRAAAVSGGGPSVWRAQGLGLVLPP